MNFNELIDRGYTVIPNFLNDEEVAAGVFRYNETKELAKANGIYNKNYPVFQDAKNHHLRNKIYQLLEKVRESTNITTDFVRPRADYFDTDQIVFPWHQDHEPYYQYQDNYNFLCMWMPLIKPDCENSGMTFLPYDRLMKLCPEITKDRFVGKGAKTFKINTATTTVTDDEIGDSFELPFNIEDIADSPAIAVGDLLLFRCDAIHRSQDHNDQRVAMSVRCLNSTGLITRKQFFSGGLKKYRMISNNAKSYELIRKLFDDPNRDSIQISELIG
jgi:ectoine hydroxylase-related dioxygenase (phytanoyl-CoA dioxygenase family)